jgi:hypothetical protein
MAATWERCQTFRARSLGESCPLLAHIRLAAWDFECRVDHCGSGQFESHRKIITRGSLRGRVVLAKASLSQSQLV